MNAWRNTAGKRPVASERLNNSVMYGDKQVSDLLQIDVGNDQRLRTCPVIVVRFWCRQTQECYDAPVRTRLNVGSGASLVSRRTLATISAKNWLKASTLIAELACARPRRSKSSTVFHSFLRSVWSASILSCRKGNHSLLLRCRSWR